MPTYLYLHRERTDTEQLRYRTEYEVNSVDYELSRAVSHRGEAASALVGGEIKIVLKGFGDEDLFRWVFDPTKDESGEIVITDTNERVIEKFVFDGGRVASYRIHFDANLSEGVVTMLTINAGVIATDNNLTFTKRR